MTRLKIKGNGGSAGQHTTIRGDASTIPVVSPIVQPNHQTVTSVHPQHHYDPEPIRAKNIQINGGPRWVVANTSGSTTNETRQVDSVRFSMVKSTDGSLFDDETLTSVLFDAFHNNTT